MTTPAGVGDLLAGVVQDLLAHHLGHEEALGLVGQEVLGIERPAPRAGGATSTCSSRSTLSPVLAETGTMSAKSSSPAPAARSAGSIFGFGDGVDLVDARGSPAGPTSPAGRGRSGRRGRSARSRRPPRGPRRPGRCSSWRRPPCAGSSRAWACGCPGCRRARSAPPGRFTTARMRLRVVWGLSETIATFWPTSRLTRVDLPTLGRPTTVTKPERKGPALGSRRRGRSRAGPPGHAGLVTSAPEADAVDPLPLGVHDLDLEAAVVHVLARPAGCGRRSTVTRPPTVSTSLASRRGRVSRACSSRSTLDPPRHEHGAVGLDRDRARPRRRTRP